MRDIVERFTPSHTDSGSGMLVVNIGGYVRYSDYEALRQQVEKARAQGRDDGLEEAAKAAEKRYEVWIAGDGLIDGEGLPAVTCDVSACANIATAIRALKSGEGV